MRGYGLTVFQGTRVESFPVTVLGRAERALTGYDMILVRVNSGPLVQKGIGIAAGMSGSPIYVDGRLIGALAYGWGFSKEPIGGVCPIEAMQRTLGGPPFSGEARLDRTLQLGGRSYQRLRFADSDRPGVLGMRPVANLLQTDGLSERSQSLLRPQLEALGLELAAGGPGGGVSGAIPELRPGSAVGVQIMSGDFSAASTGTLTWLKGRRFLAFGHPMAMLGDVHLTMTAAHIHGILPSIQRPFKLSAQLGPIGEMSSDGTWAISGHLGRAPETVPMALRVNGKTAHRVRIAQHPLFVPAMAASACAQTVAGRAPYQGENTARLRFRVKPKGYPEIELSDTAAGKDLDVALATTVLRRLSELTQNPYEPLELESLQADLQITPGRQSAHLSQISAERSEYSPGETVRLQVTLQPYGSQRTQTRAIDFQLPGDVPRGQLQVVAYGGELSATQRVSLGISEGAPSDLAAVVGRLDRQRGRHQLSVALVLPGQRLTLAGDPFPMLPNGLREWLSLLPTSNLRSDKEVIYHWEDTDFALRGEPVCALKLVEAVRGKARAWEVPGVKASPPPAASPSPAGSVRLLPQGGQRLEVGPEALTRGTFEGARMLADGALTAGSSTRLLGEGPALPLSLTRDETGRVLLGTAGPGAIYAGTPPVLWARSGEGAVLALLARSGRIWAGTGPQGRVMLYDARGQLQRRFNLPVHYVWALVPAPAGGVYAACGLPADLYYLSPTGNVQRVWHSQEQHLRCLLSTDQGLLIGASGRATLYRMDTAAPPRVLVSLPQAGIEALARQGPDLLLATPGGLYRYNTSAPPESLAIADLPVASLAVDPSGTAWIGCSRRGALYRLGLGERAPERWSVGALAVPALWSDSNGSLAATAFPGGLLALGGPTRTGSYLSEVQDAGYSGQWGQLRWNGRAVEAQTRSGPTAVPDDSWSDWTPALAGVGLTSPPNRYLQARFSLSEASRLYGFSVTCASSPSQPSVTWLNPRGEECWSGSQTLRFKLLEGDFTRLDYRLSISSDGLTWKTLRYEGATRPAGQEESWTWSGANLTGGAYQFKLEALDRRQSPPQAVACAISRPITLSTAPPQLSVLSRKPWRARAVASQVAVVEVSYRLNGGPWLPAHPRDGLFDSPQEEFEIYAEGSVEVRVRDETGQETVQTL